MPPNMPEAIAARLIRMQAAMQQATGVPGGAANGLSAVPTRDIHTQQMPPAGVWPAVSRSSIQQRISAAVPADAAAAAYNPWAQQTPPQPYQQWPQSFQQQMPPTQSSQQPAAQMMYPNAANQYAQPQSDVFVSDRGNAALGLSGAKSSVRRNRSWRGRLETRHPPGRARSMTWRRPAWSSSMARNTI